MRTRKSPERQVMAYVEKMLNDPKMGIRGEAKEAIFQLFRRVFQKVPIDSEVERRWTVLGRLKDGKMSFDFKYSGIDLCIMALEWDGFIQRVPVPLQTG
jgi:hypothetical protein